LTQITLVDVGDDAGNLDKLTKDLAEEASADEQVVDESQAPVRQTEENDDSVLPAKLRGKSRTEIAEMYANLESSHGRMANELGTQRQLTDRLLDLKRTGDLQANTPAKVKVTRDDILADDPTPSIERLIDARLKPLTDALDQRLTQVSASNLEAVFVSKHPDYQQVAADPEFVKWVQASNLRVRAAQAAKGGDFSSADILLSEFKQERTRRVAAKQESREVDLEGARQVGLESGTSADNTQSKKGGKVYRRSELIKLRMDDPERYYSDDFQQVILKAYSEGRVK
jgi:hypothetical protein